MFFDTGDLFFKTTRIPNFLEEQYKLQAQTIAKVYGVLNPVAITVGEKDFAVDLNFLKDLVEMNHLPVIASNLFDENNNPIFEKHKIHRVGDLSLGIFALVSETAFKTLPNYEKLKIHIEDPIKAAQKIVYYLKKNKKVNYVILLSHLGLFQDKFLVEKVQGIDFIFGGHSEDTLQTPENYKGALIFQSGSKGYYLGELGIKLESPQKDVVYEHKLYEMNASLDPGVEQINQIVSEFKGQLETLKDPTKKVLSSKKFETHTRCVQCHTKQTEIWKKSNHASAFLSLYAMNQHFNKDCAACHTVGLGQEGGFSNLHQATLKKNVSVSQVELVNQMLIDEKGEVKSSIQKLIEKQILKLRENAKNEKEGVERGKLNTQLGALQKIQDSKSLQGSKLDFRENTEIYKELKKLYRGALERQGLSIDYWGVQCENCHGARAGHLFEKAVFSKVVPSNVCYSCHTKSQSPQFDIKRYLLVEGKHKKGEFDFVCAIGKP
ncbi:MAG: hypothetical protein HYS98_02765 [Deltaproteobacteria bacterium]|nr:hypothetical protein [Deltaproteobacteria bacterium]